MLKSAGEVKERVREGERAECRVWRVAVLAFWASEAAQGAEAVVKGCGAVSASSAGFWSCWAQERVWEAKRWWKPRTGVLR